MSAGDFIYWQKTDDNDNDNDDMKYKVGSKIVKHN
jgi:hypothetical protein